VVGVVEASTYHAFIFGFTTQIISPKPTPHLIYIIFFIDSAKNNI